jgi:EpsD family peptidyl-prolyl cis-trans isomerase
MKPISTGRTLATVTSLALAVTLLAACGQKKDPAATQAAAKVNKSEITVHQINFLLSQQRGLKPEQTDAASRQVLERLIDQELALQKADELKLDRDARVVQQLEMARRELLARAYLEKVGDAATKPTADEVKQYYDSKPALFSERRVYNLQEILVEAKPEQAGAVREMLAAAKTIPEFLEKLKAAGFRFNGNQAVRAAEQLPLAQLDAIARLKDGQAMVAQGTNGLQVVALAGSRTQTLTLDQARPFIEQFLLAERKRKLVEEQMKSLRKEAKLTYVGKFADKPASGAASGAAAPAEAAASAMLPAGDVSKGMGIK